MKYFNPSYWFKMWVLSAPLFNSKSEGIHAKSIDNQNIKDWASKNTTNISFLENQEITLSNNQTSLLNLPLWNTNLTTHNQHHKHRHQKSRNRYKRRPIPPSKEIFQLSEKLIINQNNPNQYRSSFQSILESLTNNNILRIIFDDSENRNWGENSRIFDLNAQNFGYFRVPIEIRGEQDRQSYARNLELVLRTDNLYVQGFIITERQREIDINYYYHFDFTNININMQPRNVQNGLVPLLTRIENFENIQLTGIRPDYVDLLPTNINNINWQSIFNSFLTLTNGIDISQERPLGSLAQALGQVIFATAEAMRFPDIYARIVTHLIQRDENINLQRNQRNDIYRILVSWGTNSRNSIFRWLLQIANTIQNTPNMMISPPSIVDFTRELNLPAVQVVLGYIEFQRIRNIGRNANCRRGKRDITNKFWHEKFCDLKPQIDKIQGKITAIKVLDENTKNENLKAGDIFVGTTEGFYLINDNGNVTKCNGITKEITVIKIMEKDSNTNKWFKKGDILVGTKQGIYSVNNELIAIRRMLKFDDEIKDIYLDNSYNFAYVKNKQEEFYYLQFQDWGNSKMDIPMNINFPFNPVTASKIKAEIKIARMLDKNNKSENLEVGTIYVGTKNGVYLIYPEGEVHRFDNLNFPIQDIVLDGNGSAYVINDKCEIYHLNLVGWGSEKLNNIESCDLNKELKIYYNYNHENEVFHHQILFLTDSLKHNEIFTINLKNIHPVNNYKKMEFIGDVYSDKWGVKSAWGSWVSDGNKENYWPSNHYDLGYFMRSRNNNFHDIIQHKKFDAINIQNNNIEENFSMLLQKVDGANLIHTMWYESRQRAGLSWYRENNNNYLQFITYQYLNWQGSGSSLDCWMKVGNGIRLYNDETNSRKRRQVLNINNLEEKNQFKNVTKWTDEFAKTINHEQHLAIDNKTNFVASNITSL